MNLLSSLVDDGKRIKRRKVKHKKVRFHRIIEN